MSKVKTKVQNYLQAIQESAKDIENQELEFAAEEAAYDVSKTLSENRRKLSTLNKELSKARRAMPYSLSNEASILIQIEDLKRGTEVAQKIYDERFKMFIK